MHIYWCRGHIKRFHLLQLVVAVIIDHTVDLTVGGLDQCTASLCGEVTLRTRGISGQYDLAALLRIDRGVHEGGLRGLGAAGTTGDSRAGRALRPALLLRPGPGD